MERTLEHGVVVRELLLLLAQRALHGLISFCRQRRGNSEARVTYGVTLVGVGAVFGLSLRRSGRRVRHRVSTAGSVGEEEEREERSFSD